MKTIRFAIAGYGMIGKRHERHINENPSAQLVAVCDIRPREQTAFGGTAPYYPSLTEMLRAERDRIDVLCICTPNGFHAEMCIEALEAGCNVLVEKPMSLSTSDVDRVAEAERRSGRRVFCVLQNRMSPQVAWLHQLVETGVLGQIYMVQVNCFWNRTDRYYTPGHWHGTADIDGGTLFTQYLHFVDVMCWIFGEITNVRASFHDFNHQTTTDFEDSGVVNFDFERGGTGVLCYSTAIWDTNFECSLTVVAQNGTVRLGGQYMNVVNYCNIRDYIMPQLQQPNAPNDYGGYQGSASNHAQVISNVVAELNGCKSDIATLADGRMSIATIEKIYACKSGGQMFRRLQPPAPETVVAVVGLGYVGLPLAMAFAGRYRVVAYDHNPQRVEMMNRGIDPSGQLAPGDFAGDITFHSDPSVIGLADFVVVTVPTPADTSHNPDLSLLYKASATVGRHLRRGSTVVFESTVYPGCTLGECVPIIERESGMKMNVDFGVGYSPERINPGDARHTVGRVVKVVSGSSAEVLEHVAQIYASVIEAGVYRAPSIEVAEAAKIVENTQRDVNVALMNEVSVILSRMNISTHDVLDAAASKWNFVRYTPGLVGGHCIGVDPYYLDFKAAQLGYQTHIINGGRYVNDGMGHYVASTTVKKMTAARIDICHASVLVMGITYKADVGDIRNSRTADVVAEFRSFGIAVTLTDPLASDAEVRAACGIGLQSSPAGPYDAVVIAVPHRQFLRWTRADFDAILRPGAVVTDVCGCFRSLLGSGYDYWCL